MPSYRPVRSTRNTRVNYAESVCSTTSDNDSEYSPDVVASSTNSTSSDLRRSRRLIEKNSRKNRDGQKR